MMGIYDTGVIKVEYKNEEELAMLMAMYPNEDCLDNLPCPPPPIGEREYPYRQREDSGANLLT